LLVEHVVELRRRLQLVLEEAQAEAELQVGHRREAVERDIAGARRRRARKVGAAVAGPDAADGMRLASS